MRSLRWRDHEPCFEMVMQSIRDNGADEPYDIQSALKACTDSDPLAEVSILGVESYHIAFLEYLFHKAQGPYSPGFEWVANVIQQFFLNDQALRYLINLNAPDTLANMILNKRGRLKFLISDQLELEIILQWWKQFGLDPVNPKDIFDAILNKSTIRDRISQGDPLLILRLLDVFPEFSKIINPKEMSRETLLKAVGTITHPPSERRYHQLFATFLKEGRDIRTCIQEEEQRVLPMQMKRNRFLAYLVKNLHENKCQICSLRGEETRGPVEVHHIKPLSFEGKDKADNMLVICKTHHQAIHAGQITVRFEKGGVQIICPNGIWTINH